MFSASNPQRVERVALYGSFATLWPPDDPDAAGFDPERFLRYVEREWGSGRVLSPFTNAPDDAEALALTARYERGCASPKLAATILRNNMAIDARELVSAVSAPTLVVHQIGDPIVSVRRGRELAASLPGGRLLELGGNFHCGWSAADWEPVLDAVEEFFTGHQPETRGAERILATVLFTDIVDSTRRAAAAGDREWRAVLDAHDSAARRTVAEHGGRLVKLTGDGMLATFDGPARGVRCAQAFRDAMQWQSVLVRAGLHTGEVELRGEDVGGIAVHIGARVCSRAGASEVLASRTVRDLVVGSDLRFEDRGSFELRGVPDQWQLYAAVG